MKKGELNKIEYIGLKLTQASKDIIKSKVIMKHDNVFCDHVTLWYFSEYDRDVNKAGYDSYNYGEQHIYQQGRLALYETMEEMKYPVLFKATSIKSDDRCQLLTISHLDHLVNDMFQVPHITLSTHGDTKPVYSNELLSKQHVAIKTEKIDMLLEGHLKFYKRIGESNGE